MQHYNHDETLRREWINILTRASTGRQKKRKQLTELLNYPGNFQQFLVEREKLLSDTHGQGILWLAPDEGSILWKILQIFGINKREGSRLRRILADPPKIDAIIEIPREIPTDPTDSLDTDAAFEEAMYSNPKLALAWIQQHILQLEKDSGSVTDTTTNNVLERLSAFRSRLPEMEYLKLLKQVAGISPKQALIHLNQQITSRENHSTNHDFIEIHCFSELLFHKALFSGSSNPLNPIIDQYDNAIMLLIILENNLNEFLNYYTSKENQRSLQENMGRFLATHSELNRIYRELVQNDKYPQSEASYLYTKPLVTTHIYKLLLDQILFDYVTDNKSVFEANLSRSADPRNRAKLNTAWTNFGASEKKVASHGKGAQTFRWIEKEVTPDIDTPSLPSATMFYDPHPKVTLIQKVIRNITSHYPQTAFIYPETTGISALIQNIESELPGKDQRTAAHNISVSLRKQLSPLQIDWIILRMQEHYQRNTVDQAKTEGLINAIRDAFNLKGELASGDQQDPTDPNDNLPTSSF